MKNVIKTKKKLRDKPQGQALLIVLVISTLTMLILLGVASRIDISRNNIRRSSEFDRAVAASDNALNQVIQILEKGSCPLTFNPADYTLLKEEACPDLRQVEDDIQVFGKQSSSKQIETSPTQPISLFLGDTMTAAVPSTGVRVTCERDDARYRFIVTRVYQDADGAYRTDKGITDCRTVSTLMDRPKGNINLYGLNGAAYGVVSEPGNNGFTPVVRGNTKLVRVRPLDLDADVPATNKISIELINTVGGSSEVVASTSKYEFVIVGAGGLGSDVAIQFEKQRGDFTYVPSAFDFVYFGDETQ